MDRVKSAALACLFGVACGGDPEPQAGAGSAAPAATPGANRPPVVESVALDPPDPRPGQQVSARVTASDPDGDLITLDYRWLVSGAPVDSANGQPSLHVEGKERGSTIEVSVTARDAHGESQPLTASAHLGNQPPTIVQVDLLPAPPVTAGRDLTANAIGTDPEGDSIEYRYEWQVNQEIAAVDGPTLPASMFKRGDKIELKVVASDGDNESEPLTSAPLEVGDSAPKIVSQPGAIGDDGVFRYAVQVEDPDGDRVFRWRLAKAPQGMTIGFDDGKIEWEIPADAAGSHNVEIEVQDRSGGKGRQAFALQVDFSDEEKGAAGDEAKERGAAPADASETESES